MIRTSGKDDVYNTSDDLLTTYGFDSSGRAVSCYTTDISGTQIYGASNGQYVGEDNEKAKNNLKSSVQTTQQSSNYLINGGFENSSSSLSPWSTTGSVQLNTSSGYEGEHSALVTVNSSVSSSSVYQTLTLDKGEYFLSLYMFTREMPDVSIYLKAESLTNSANSVTHEISANEYLATTKDYFNGVGFSVTSNTEQVKISITVTGTPSASRSVIIDSVMLSKTTGASEFDMTNAGHFEYNTSNFWSYDSSYVSIVDSGVSAFGNVMKVNNGVNGLEFPSQVVYKASDERISDYDSGYYYEDDPMLFTV